MLNFEKNPTGNPISKKVKDQKDFQQHQQEEFHQQKDSQLQ